MDYILEELLRQRAALTALLLGGERAGEPEDGPGPAGPEGYAAAGPEPRRGGSGSRGAAGPGAEVRAAPGVNALKAEGGAGGGWRRLAPGLGGPPGDGGGEALAAGGPGDGGLEVAGAGPSAQRPPAALWPGGPAAVTEVREVLEVSAPAREASLGPEALSRAVQRDARRYDGGFFLY